MSVPPETASGSEQPPPVYAAPPADGRADANGGERPEVLVGAAFAGGLVLALILKRLGS